MKTIQILSLTAALIGASTSMARAANIVTNGGFETGDFSGFTQSGNTGSTFVSTTNPHTGTYAADLGPAGALGFLSQSLATTPGQTYQLSYFLASTDTAPNNEFQTSVGGTKLFDQVNIPTQAYTQYTFNFVPTGTSTDLTFGFRDNPRNFYLDDVSVNNVTAVPTPSSTLGLLTLVAFIGGSALKHKLKQPVNFDPRVS